MNFNPTEKKKITGAFQELSDCMARMEAEKELMKDIIDVTYENHGIEKKHICKLATIHHKRNMDEVKSNNNEVEDLYETLFQLNKGNL